MESTSELVPNTVADKTVGAVEVPEKTNDKNVVEEHVTITVKKRIEGDKVVEEKTVTEKKAVEKTDSNSAEQEEVEEIVEEVEVEDDEAEGEEGVDQKITEEVVETPDGGQTKTITVTTVKKTTPGNTKTVVTTTSVTKETPTSTSTIIMTTPPTPTTEEVKTETTEDDDKRTKEIEEVNEHEDVKKEPEVKEVNEHEDVKKEPEVKEVNEEKVVHEAEEEEEEEEEEEDEEEEEEEEEKLNDKKVNEVKKSEESDQQNKDQIPERDSQPEQVTPVKEETVVDAPSDLPQNNQNETASKQDSNIKAEENIAALKQRELELLKKQQELAKEIEQQRILAQKLANENLLKQQQQQSNNLSSIPATTYQPTSNVSKYSTFEEKQDNNVFTRKSETFETRESTNVSKKIDLHKIFTPATDAEEILPKNRKLYASSAFYSPTLHPTVEDQVELARRISHSLSDISNQQSRGQSMYVNRKKRSVKWVHEGCGQEEENIQHDEYDQEEKENSVSHHEKVPLKFLMNPNGQMRDINSLRESLNTETGLLSPDVSAEVVTALQTQKGKGAELFAKRRKVSEKWVVDENNVGAQSPSGLPDYHQYQQPRPSTSPSILPAYTDAAKHRVQLNLHQEQLLEKYAKPGLKVVQTPWEAALNSGSASAAFVEEQKLSPYQTAPLTPSPTPQLYDASQGNLPIQSASTVPDSYRKPYSSDDYNKYPTQTTPLQQTQYERQQYSGTNSQRELAYKPSIPQGWKAPSMSLPKVGFEEVSHNGNNCTSNEIKGFDQQYISTVLESAKSYEEFNAVDETELINLIREDVKEVSYNCTTATSSKTSKNTLSTEEHQFVNHLVKSPELRLSPIPISTQVIYDNAVQELHMKQQKQLKKEKTSKTIETCDNHSEDVNEKAEKVNVRKQLQQYEDLHRQFAEQIEKEEQLQRKREYAKLKALQKNNNKKLPNKQDDSPKSIVSQISEQQHAENEEEYVKVPVKDLITNFEQQCQQQVPSSCSTVENNINLEQQQHIENNIDHVETQNEDLYMPKEIPLQSYAPPPVSTGVSSPIPPFSTNYESNQNNTYKPLSSSPLAPYSAPEPAPAVNKTYSGGGSTFPVGKPYQQGFSSSYGSNQPPKQQYLPPQSYQKVPQNTSQNIPQVNFNPSPLPYDKLAKFENQPADDGHYIHSPTSRVSHLNVRGSKVRNTSPAPFGGSYNRSYTPSSEPHHYGGTPSHSPRPLSSLQQYSGHNTPNSYPSIRSNQILNAPSYNTSARGWGCNTGASTDYHHTQSHISAPKPQIVNAASMPYTDF
ncbi:uncharacterized protein ACRADG_012208 isoform 2-T3 [Cochliomyia hominivorax]